MKTGKDYVARAPLYGDEATPIAEAGQTCERVRPSSLPWLLAEGLIAEVAPAPPAPALEGDDRGN